MAITTFKGKNSFLSNFFPCQVYLDGIDYNSVEHAYQAAKSSDPDERLKIRNAGNAAKAKKLGQKVKNLLSDWDTTKLGVMKDLLKQKFAPGSICSHKLIETDGHDLEEGNWWGDRFWGVCNGVGENHLGKMLMEIRDTLLEGK